MKRCEQASFVTILLGCGLSTSALAQNSQQATPAAASVFVTNFNLIGADALPPGLLDSYLSEHTLQKKTLVELRRLAAQLEKQLQTRHGLASAKVWVPLQEDKLGIVDLRVLPGQIRQVQLARPAANDRETKALALLVEQFKPGALLEQSTLERTSLLLTKLLGETPRLTLEPSPTMGQYDLVLEPVVLEKYSLSASIDNLGSRYTNPVRDKTQLQIRNSLFNADSISLTTQMLTPNQKLLQMRYEVPLGLSNFKFGISNLSARYQLVDAFASLQAKGDIHFTGIDLSNSLVRSEGFNLTVRGEALSKRSRSTQAGVPTTDRRMRSFNLGLFGDAPALGGTSAATVVLTTGNVDLSLVTNDVAADTAKIAGRYQKLNARVEQSVHLGASQKLQINLGVQRAGKNLDSTESMLIGGISGVRAYPIGEAASDRGAVLNLELHHRWTEQLRGLLFYDHGWATIRQTPAARSTAANNYDINGAGFSLVWSPTASTEMALMPAWKLKANRAADLTTGADSDGKASKMRVWFFATQQF